MIIHGKLAHDDVDGLPETIYYYRVKACNVAGCSDFSAYDSGYRVSDRSLYQRLFLQLTEDTQLLSKSFGAVQAGQMITKCTAVPQQLFKIVALL